MFLPEEMCGGSLLAELARVEHLRISHIAKWIHRVHEDGLLEQQRLPDVLASVIIVPEDAQIVKFGEQTHAVGDGGLLVGRLGVHCRVDRNEMDDII